MIVVFCQVEIFTRADHSSRGVALTFKLPRYKCLVNLKMKVKGSYEKSKPESLLSFLYEAEGPE